jgi:dihydrofolate reductase
MGKLIYSAICSLDGYVNDANGGFDWSAPDDEVHAFVNDLERNVATYLYGRRLYEVMQVWQQLDTEDESAAMADYASIWRAADKVVFSTTLDVADTPRTRIERDFAPETIEKLKASSPLDLSIGGATLAGVALAAGLVDEIHLLLSPIVVGGGTRALPDDVILPLALLSERRFAGGVVHLHYALRR